MLLQFFFVLVAIILGARLGGIGLGVMGGIGLGVLTFIFGLQPTSPPIDVMLMIVAVIAAAGCMQAAGGLDLMVRQAEKLLRRNPSRITLLSPLVTYLFTFVAGTGHVAYSVLPVIAEVARETKIRPERPMAIAVIASQQAITASPISAATVALLSMLTGYHLSLLDILMISIPSTIVGVLLGALYSLRVGKDLEVDPEYLRRLEAGEFDEAVKGAEALKSPWKAAVSVGIFVLATVLIVLFGSIEELRRNGDTMLQMPSVIEILMLSAAALILLITRTNGIKAAQGSVFSAGMQAVVAIFGIAWMGDTFLNGNMTELRASIEGVVTSYAVAFRNSSFRDVDPALQPGGHRAGFDAAGHCAGYFTVDAGGVVSCRERLFFHSELSDRRRRDQFRPHRYHPDRQIRAESFVHDAGADRNDRGHVDRPVADPVFGTVISAKIFARRFFDFPCQCFLSVSPRLSTGISSLAPGRIS